MDLDYVMDVGGYRGIISVINLSSPRRGYPDYPFVFPLNKGKLYLNDHSPLPGVHVSCRPSHGAYNPGVGSF